MHFTDVKNGSPRILNEFLSPIGPPSYEASDISDLRNPPTLGDWAEAGVDQLDTLMPRKPEVHEPLPIQQPSHLLQYFNPPPIDV